MPDYFEALDGFNEPCLWTSGKDQPTCVLRSSDVHERFWPDVVARMTGTSTDEPLSAEQYEMRGSWSQPYDLLTHEYPPTPEIAAKVADALLQRIATAMWDADDAARIADGEADMIMPRDNRQVNSEYLGHASAALAALSNAREGIRFVIKTQREDIAQLRHLLDSAMAENASLRAELTQARMTGTVVTNDDATVERVAMVLYAHEFGQDGAIAPTARAVLAALTGVPHD